MSLQEVLNRSKREKNEREYQALVKAEKELDEMGEESDAESAHWRAEEILCEYLAAIGAKSLAVSFNNAKDRVGFWYA